MSYDAIIIGSGAGGSAAAYHLAQTGYKVLLLERGTALPRDGSTLDVGKVMRHHVFLSDEAWIDRHGRTVVPQERFNLGGKTKWYGAALLRYAPHEFRAEPSHQCLGFPIDYESIEPFYEEAETLLGVRDFPIEADLQEIVAGLRRKDSAWHRQALPMALSPGISDAPREARHFDGFASAGGLKGDAETALLDRLRTSPNLTIATGRNVVALLAAAGNLRRVRGVTCEDGTTHEADTVILSAGALHSPRLLQDYLERTRLAGTSPAYELVGRNYKYHVLTALLALSVKPKTDALRKTTLLTHERLPHSSVQPLGWIDGEILATELPSFVPAAVSNAVGRRAYGFFLQTEDGSHPDNRVAARANGSGRPLLDYDPARVPAGHAEHRRLVRTLSRQLLSLGYLPLIRPIPIAGTAHACGTLVTGADPGASVVDPDGRVWGLENVFVADGSVLPRSSRVNPALTIYAWGLRLGSLVAGRENARRIESSVSA